MLVDQHAVNVFQLVRVSVSAKQLKVIVQMLYLAFHEELNIPEFVLYLNYYYFILSIFLCFSIFSLL